MTAGLTSRLTPALGRVRRELRRRNRLGRRWLMRARLDFQDVRSGKRDPLLPPRRLNLPSQIAAIGDRLVALMKEQGGLDEQSAVLDIGCGPGRVAAPLTRFLGPTGRYEGFDVMPKSINWATKAITSRHPNFRFQLADIENGEYNPKGTQRASEYVFPYGDDSFDVAVAASLFTHLVPFESERYLAETARTLKPGGRIVGTWFLLNEESESALERGVVQPPGLFSEQRPALKLEYHLTDERGNPFRSFNKEIPEFMIAVPEADVRALHEQAGLRIVETFYGRWAGREDDGLIGQDVIVAELPA